MFQTSSNCDFACYIVLRDGGGGRVRSFLGVSPVFQLVLAPFETLNELVAKIQVLGLFCISELC